MGNETQTFRTLFAEYMEDKDLEEDWNVWLKEKDNDVQEQKTEEDSEKDKKE